MLFVSCDVETPVSPGELDVTCTRLWFAALALRLIRGSKCKQAIDDLTIDEIEMQLAIRQEASPRQGQRKGTKLFRKILDQS